MARLTVKQDQNFSVGDKVLVGTTQEPGAVKFIGTTHFSPGEWVGVELEKAVGKNDGTVQDTKYFECKNNHGLFVRRTALVSAPTSTKQAAPAKAKGKVGNSRTTPRAGSAGKLEAPAKASDSTRPRPSADTQSPLSSAALASLRTASEEQDVDQLQVAIKTALQAGVAPEEIQKAQEILSSQSQKVLRKEFERIRSVVSGLTESVRITQARVSAAESIGPDSMWVATVVERIEKRAWQALEQKIEDRIQIAVRKVSAELITRSQTNMSRNTAEAGRPPAGMAEEALREKARSSLVKGLRSGSLASAADGAQVLQDTTNTPSAVSRESVLKERARRGLVEGLQNGSLEITVNKGKTMRASQAEGQAMRDRERELRKKAKIGLVSGLKDGSLKRSIAKSADRQSNRLLPSAGVQALPCATCRSCSNTGIDVISGKPCPCGLPPIAEGKDIKEALDPDKAVRRIQSWWRRRRKAIKASPVSAAVRKAQVRNKEWCEAFQECLPSHSTTGLDAEAFDKALQKALPGRAASGQTRALIKGYLEGTGRSEMDLMGFVSVAEAVTLGPAAAAEYADINMDTYQMLGRAGADSASSKIGSLARGRAVRAQSGVSASAKSGVGSAPTVGAAS